MSTYGVRAYMYTRLTIDIFENLPWELVYQNLRAITLTDKDCLFLYCHWDDDIKR